MAAAVHGPLVGSPILTDPYTLRDRLVRRTERLDHLFEARCDWITASVPGGPLAIDADGFLLTYAELDARANRLARYLRKRGTHAGERVGLLLDRPVDSCVAVLGVLKAGAAYVPLDIEAPVEHLARVAAHARVRTVLSTTATADRVPRVGRLAAHGAELVCLDRVARAVAAQDPRRLVDDGAADGNRTACVSYLPGPDNTLTGVAVDHAALCTVVRGVAEAYDLDPTDRVYQGLPVGTHGAVEEVWVPWACGATVVPAPSPAPRGPALHAFLASRRITVLRCAPDELAAVEDDLPDLRFLLLTGVTGAACPPDLVARWHRRGRRLLHGYAPDGATTTAIWTELSPDRPTVVGVPLPGYSAVVLDRRDPRRALPHGEVGEIGLAGAGLRCGYLRANDLPTTFVPDVLGVPANPSGRILRTGDLGRITPTGQIELLGQVDLRSGTADERTVPSPQPTPYPRLRPTPRPTPEPPAQQTAAPVPTQWPGLRQVRRPVVRPVPPAPPAVPTPAVPAPAVPAPAAATEDLATVLAGVLGEILGTGDVPVDGHFFDDLGADSMVMARFCARVRKRPDLPSVSMKDVYRHPTIAGLARALGDPAPETAATPGTTATRPLPPDPLPDPVPGVGRAGYLLCGALQLTFFLGYSALAAVVTTTSYGWISAGTGPFDVYLRAVTAGGAAFVGLCTLPILAKWVLIGRWRPRRIRVWSLTYVRFWIVKILVRSDPLVLFVGSPLYVLYLRALGARVGRGVAIFARNVPVCADLLRIGDGTVVAQDAFFSCYRARAGMIETGPVILGSNVFVAEATVLDIRTYVGDGAQLGRSSSLHAGQVVPDGERWHGSPARPTDVDYRAVGDVPCGTLRRIVYSAAQLLNTLFVYLPLGFGGTSLLVMEVPQLAALLAPGPAALTSATFYRDALIAATSLFLGAFLVGLLLVMTLPRLLNRLLRPDRVYRLYGVHYSLYRTIVRLTNVKFFTRTFGDSSAITGYLRCLGWDLGRVDQSGSNFGTDVRQEIPYLSAVGSGTMVADGLSMLNSSFSSTGFRVSRVSIGPRNFLGNRIAYPPEGRTGANCLLATKVLVPIDGKVREGVGLLGSPSFEIPRSVERDGRFDQLKSADELRRRLRRKNRHNLATVGLFLLTRWLYVVGLVLLTGVALDLYDRFGALALAFDVACTPLFTVAYFVLLERAVTAVHPLTPLYRSIYERDFWRRERYWKVPAEMYLQVFNGTPYKTLVLRMLGVPVGRRVFDDGCYLTERTLCAIGDDCTLNAGSVVQCHSQEDGTFKSDRSAIGAGVTLGVGAFVHYGVTMAPAAVLSADSFLMKGEAVPAGAYWGGNPAVEIARAITGETPGAAPAAPVDPDVAEDRCAEPATVGAGRL